MELLGVTARGQETARTVYTHRTLELFHAHPRLAADPCLSRIEARFTELAGGIEPGGGR